MKNFDWFTNVIVPSILTFIFMLLAFMRNKIRFLLLARSNKRIANRLSKFHSFIQCVVLKEINGKARFYDDSSKYEMKHTVEFAKFKDKIKSSELIEFKDMNGWTAHEDNKIKEFYYFLNISEAKKKKYV